MQFFTGQFIHSLKLLLDIFLSFGHTLRSGWNKPTGHTFPTPVLTLIQFIGKQYF